MSAFAFAHALSRQRHSLKEESMTDWSSRSHSSTMRSCNSSISRISLPRTICLPTFVLIPQAIFLLERGQTDRQTDRQTDATKRPINAGGYTAVVGNNLFTDVTINN